MTDFTITASNPSSSLNFSNKSGDYFDLTLKTPALSACKKVYIYTYAPTNVFVEFFERLASFSKSWPHQETWETLEGELMLKATCDAVGHVEIEVKQQNMGESENWSLNCTMVFDLGSLSKISSDAKRFMTM